MKSLLFLGILAALSVCFRDADATCDGKSFSYCHRGNSDCYGRDIRFVRVNSLEQCKSACDNECRCKSIQQWGRTCWLKYYACSDGELSGSGVGNDYVKREVGKEGCPYENVDLSNAKCEGDDNIYAVAYIRGEGISGTIHIRHEYTPSGGSNGAAVREAFLLGEVNGLSAGNYGMHIHQFGDVVSDGCQSTGGHYNPYNKEHGGPEDANRHVGDLGNIESDDFGTAYIDILDKQVSLVGRNSVVGRAIVIHAGEDDLGQGGDDGSKKTGNAGGRAACGVIVMAPPEY